MNPAAIDKHDETELAVPIGKRAVVAVICLALMAAAIPGGPCPAVLAANEQRDELDRDDEFDFQREILPVLSDRCFSCHGPDEGANISGLRLDTRAAAIGELPSGDGRAIVPGRPQRSEMIRRIKSTDPDLVMPPADAHRQPISAEELAKLEAWIAAGAPYQQHWSFESLPATVEVPEVPTDGWGHNTIDRFVLAALARQGLTPAPEAERWRWLRRVSLDLTGLPPTIEELDAFENDTSPDAYDVVVQRLLDSPRFGEHWAVDWLDVARYADSYGYQSDLICQVWPYRDWIVKALNDNLPYDQFLRNQLAGDLLPNATTEEIVATAFNRLHRQTNEGGSIDLEWRIEYAADRVQTFGLAFLGLTLECARCHDHKFDPITQRDYYQLMAFFNSIDEAGTYNDAVHIPTPTILLPTDDQRAHLASIDAELRALDDELLSWHTLARAEYEAWKTERTIAMPRARARYALDEIVDGTSYIDAIEGARPATTAADNRPIPGYRGNALQFSGDDPLNVPAFELRPWQPFTISCWLHIPATTRDAILWHQTTGTDTGFSGTELILHEGRLRLAMNRFWPGNSLAIDSAEPLPRDRWVFVAAKYDGSGTAQGMTLFIDSRPSQVVVRNHLYKTPAAGQQLGFGSRFRTRGPQGGAIDQIELFDSCLSDVELDCIRLERNLTASEIADDRLFDHFLNRVHDGTLRALSLRREQLARRFSLLDTCQELMVMRELATPTETFVLDRGAYDSPRTPDRRVERDTPASLPAFPEGAPRDRLGLADWLTAPDHPLTARVAVNRMWQHFFGVGLVETAEDFGLQGTRPTHPELLDWLARDFVDHGWDVKRLCRQIALSATYRQTSQVDLESRRRDPRNVALARGPAARMSGEMLRDLALFVSGLLHERRGGPPVSPYQPEGLWTENNSFSPAYQPSAAPDIYRRSLYSVWKRTAPLPNMLAFDAVSRETCVARRGVTQTPSQALVLLNDPQFVEAATATARRVLALPLDDDTQRARWLFRSVTGRRPTEDEVTVLLRLLNHQRAIFAADVAAARLLAREAANGEEPAAGESIECAAWSIVCQAVLNCDASVWKR